MPFMIGPAPIRRTLKYLEKGKIIFRDTVKIFSVNYELSENHHYGTREFVFWHLQQIQYKNPSVQCITFKNMTPSPFIKIFFEDGNSLLVDTDSRSKEEILSHLENFTAICLTQEEIKQSQQQHEVTPHPSFFGVGCERHCMCEIFGQVPCPNIVSLPTVWRGAPSKNPKYRIPPFYMQPGLEKYDNDEEN